MAIFKCKMCGGLLEISEGLTVATCDYCGSQQTIPKLDDEKRAALYDRASHLRQKYEYDAAISIYEQILSEDKTDAEAYWSLVLCRYGIEYVEDPASHKRVPTINRLQFASVLADEDYKYALKYADGYQKDIYAAEAKAIDKIQKGILAISGKEKPFDVFICYKETDSNGKRTHDSVLANDLYYQLKQEGFKVFYSRITLEDKLGSAYEPYIFAALNSAKVMVVLGTKPEHFNAVWVKNEWSRYLSLIKGGEKKTLIPAYKDMDPYDLPKEFAHLQAQDMSKLGFMLDLVRVIKKILGSDSPKANAKDASNSGINLSKAEPLLKRAFLFLEDGDWDSADEYAEKVLDINPECSEAYIVKLLTGLELRKPEHLASYPTSLESHPHYKKALRFANPEYRVTIESYNNAILDRIEAENKENTYIKAMSLIDEEEYDEAISLFSEIVDYKDSSEKIEHCTKCKELARCEAIYVQAVQLTSENGNRITIEALEQSLEALRTIPGYKDVDERIPKLEAFLEKCYEAQRRAEEEARVRAENEKLARERKAQQERIKAEKIKRKMKLAAKIGIPSVAAVVMLLILTFTLFIPTARFNKADEFLNAGDYKSAKDIYMSLDGFSDSKERLKLINSITIMEKANSYIESSIEDLLELGIPVKLTYDVKGGDLSGAQYLEAPQDNSSSGAMMLSTSGADSSVSNEYTYSKSDEFDGMKQPTKLGCRFVKWKLDTFSYKLGGIFEIKVYAVWSEKDYDISYNYDGGTVAKQNPSIYSINDDTFTLTNPTKTGYTFIGWTGTGLDGLTMTVTVNAGSAGYREYKANWKANNYTITLNSDGGSVSSENITVTYDSSYELPVPTKPGYTFNGWFAEYVKYDKGTWSLARNETLKASWTANKYTITYKDTISFTNPNPKVTFDYNYSGTTPKTVTLRDGEVLEYPVIPSREGYVFTGWYTDSSCAKTYSFTEKISDDMTLYAGWMAHKSDAYANYNISASFYPSSSAYSISNSGTSSSNTKNIYLVANESGVHNIYYKNSSSTYATYIQITNMTTGFSIKGVACKSISYDYVTFSCKAGDVIVISIYQYNYAYSTVYAYFYFSGFYSVESTAEADCGISYAPKVTFDYNYPESTPTVVTVDNGSTLAYPEVPERSGYLFAGWYTDAACQYKYEFNNKFWYNKTLYAKWILNEKSNTVKVGSGASVIFNGQELSYYAFVPLVSESISVYSAGTLDTHGYLYDSLFSELVSDDDSADGSNFAYTYNVTAGKLYYIGIKMYSSAATGNAFLYIKGTQKPTSTAVVDVVSKFFYSKVTFDYNYDGSTPTDIILYEGDKLAYPEIPERSGYVFTGWYTDSSCTERYSFTGKITENKTLYAGWEAQKTENVYNSYIITNPQDYTSSGSSYSISNENTTATSQKYVYLTIHKEGTHKIYYGGQYTYIGITNMTTGKTIKETSRASSSYSNVSFTAAAGDVIVISIYRYSINDYSNNSYYYFVGFSAPSSTVTAEPAIVPGMYYLEGAESTQTVEYGSSYTLPDFSTLSTPGYTFAWYNGSTKLESGIWQGTENVTLTPVRRSNEYTITLDPNGGTLQQTSIKVNYNEVYELPTPTRTGYTFDGWFVGTTEYESGTWNVASDVTLVAKWTANTYNITYDDTAETNVVVSFNPNYSGATTTTTTLTNGQTLTYPTVPTRSGYAFVGWYTDSSCKTKYNFSGTITENITLYAKWSSMTSSYNTREYVDIANYNSSSSKKTFSASASYSSSQDYYYFTCYTSGSYTIYAAHTSGDFYITVYNATQGRTIMSKYNLYGSSSSKSASFTANEGDIIYVSLYKYSSYDSAGAGTFYVSGANYPSSTATANCNTVEGYVYDSNSSISQTIDFGEPITLPTPIRMGYSFLGWYEGETKVESGEWCIASNVTLVPKWQEN